MEVILEILKRHWNGIDFVEWECQDSQMKEEGKHVKTFVDHNTGIIFGGNKFNCHTWMDKMGSSEHFGNKGVPSTPRNGAAIEINLIALFCLRKISQISGEEFL